MSLRTQLFPSEFFVVLERLVRRQRVEGLGRKPLHLPGQERAGFERRDYQPGDDVRRLDWRASARSTRAQVRLREQDRGGRLCVLLDRSRSLVPWDAQRDFDQRRLACAVGWLHLEAGGAVEMYAAPGPPQRVGGWERRHEWVRILSDLNPPHGTDLEAMPTSLYGSRFEKLVAIGDPWGSEPWWTLLELAALSCSRTQCITLVVPEEDRPPVQDLILENTETGEVQSHHAHSSYSAHWHSWLQRRRNRSRSIGLETYELRCGRFGGSAATILNRAREAQLV